MNDRLEIYSSNHVAYVGAERSTKALTGGCSYAGQRDGHEHWVVRLKKVFSIGINIKSNFVCAVHCCVSIYFAKFMSVLVFHIRDVAMLTWKMKRLLMHFAQIESLAML
jgi:hypothetical protein